MLVPDSIATTNQATFKTPNTTGTLVQSTQFNELWLGATAARRLSATWTFGATLFGIRRQESNVAGLVVDIPGTANSTVDSLIRTELSFFGVALNLGLAYRPNPWLGLGFRLQSPYLQLSGSASTVQRVRSVANGTLTPTDEYLTGTPASYRLPLDMTLGSVFYLNPSVTLYWDLSFQLGQTYDSIPASTLSDHIVVVPTLRTNLGMKFALAANVPLRLGFFWNPSALQKLSVPDGSQTLNYWGITGGLSFVGKNVETGLGAFYIGGSGQTAPTGGTAGQFAKASANGFGALLTTGYLF